LYIAPGNAGTAQIGRNVAIGLGDFEALGKFAVDNAVDMLVVGPEEPLVNGIADYFNGHPALRRISVIGPSKAGAQLEGSKDFAKKFMMRHRIPTAAYRSFRAEEERNAQDFIRSLSPPYVLKADGLAAGKGVVIVSSLEDAFRELHEMFSGKFGAAGNRVVVEEFLSGVELSVFVLTDGKNYLMLPEAKDYKRIGEGDAGLNTGGMGAVSPVPFADQAFMDKVESRIVRPTVEGLCKDGIPYKGFIFFGLMNVGGEPTVIEYNVRLGDPETEAVLPRIQTDIVELFQAVATGNIGEKSIRIRQQTATAVMLVSGGYPEAYEKGKIITGLDKVGGDCMIFHAGTACKDGRVVTAGGRVIAVSALAENMAAALAISKHNADIIRFDGKYYRRDIGFDLKK
jgi:phosphoribosylamine--glycine ligase